MFVLIGQGRAWVCAEGDETVAGDVDAGVLRAVERAGSVVGHDRRWSADRRSMMSATG